MTGFLVISYLIQKSSPSHLMTSSNTSTPTCSKRKGVDIHRLDIISSPQPAITHFLGSSHGRTKLWHEVEIIRWCEEKTNTLKKLVNLDVEFCKMLQFRSKTFR